jgi:hypothetical protein
MRSQFKHIGTFTVAAHIHIIGRASTFISLSPVVLVTLASLALGFIVDLVSLLDNEFTSSLEIRLELCVHVF